MGTMITKGMLISTKLTLLGEDIVLVKVKAILLWDVFYFSGTAKNMPKNPKLFCQC